MYVSRIHMFGYSMSFIHASCRPQCRVVNFGGKHTLLFAAPLTRLFRMRGIPGVAGMQLMKMADGRISGHLRYDSVGECLLL